MIGRRLLEDHEVVDRLQLGEYLKPFYLVEYWSLRPLERPYRRIGIDPDDQHVTLLTCLLEVRHMARVDDIEAAVGEHDASSIATKHFSRFTTFPGSGSRGMCSNET